MEIAGLDPGVVEAFGREAIFFEDPARPAFINRWLPRTIETDASLMDRDGLRSACGRDNGDAILLGNREQVSAPDAGDDECSRFRPSEV